jgi:hypothetical protein
MRIRFAGLFVIAVVWAAVLSASAQSGNKPPKKIEMQLLWGTDAKTSPNKDHQRLADPDIQKRLENIPLRWTNYYIVKKMNVTVPPTGQGTNIPMSQKCSVNIKDLGKSTLEFSFISKTKPLEKRTQTLQRNNVFIYSGNAPGTNGWFVVLKRLE